MAGGRPTKYKEKYAEMLIDFFAGGSVDFENLNGREPVVGRFPTLARFALNIGTHTDTIANWANAENEDGTKKHPEFFSAYKAAKNYQEAFIYEGAMAGAINPTFAIWSAKAILRHRDNDQNLNQETPQPLSISFTVEDASKDASS